MKTAHNAATELVEELSKMGFEKLPEKKRVMLGAFEEIGMTCYDVRNGQGHVNLRVKIHTDGEPQPLSLSLVKFDGKKSHVIAWRSDNMSAHMPLEATLNLIKASI